MLTSNQKKFIRILKELGIYKRWLDNKRDYDRRCMEIVKYPVKLPDSSYFSFMIVGSFMWWETKEWHMWNRLHDKTALRFPLGSLTHDEILNSDTILKGLKQIVNEELHG